VVIALIVTPEGFPLAYEVMAGNTADNTTLSGFLKKIEAQYGKAERIWIMDRGIPTEEVLQEMRQSDPPVYYLVGTPKGRLSRYEKALTDIGLGIRSARGWRSSCCPKTMRPTCWRRAGTGSTRRGPCGGVN